MYASSLFIGIQNAALVQPVVAVERTVFYRERAAGMYSALPYAFGQVDRWCLYFSKRKPVTRFMNILCDCNILLILASIVVEYNLYICMYVHYIKIYMIIPN